MPLQSTFPPLILASASSARRALLEATGLRFEIIPAYIDEASVKEGAHILEASAEDTALRLARLKAQAVTGRQSAVTIGADQILVCDNTWFDKPATMEAASHHLRTLRGRTHRLATATVAYRGGVEVWKHVTSPRLTMRRFSDSFITLYLAAEGSSILSSVGAYRLEGLGTHLFDSIEGDHSAILGLPIIPLLRFLRSCDIIAA
jgi:septum formation protein